MSFAKKLVEPVLYTGDVAVGAVGIDSIKVVVDGNVANIILRECVVDVQACQRGITSKSGKVFRDNCANFSCFNLRKHFLKAWAIGEVHTTVTVVDEKRRMGKAVVPCILE